MASNSLTPPVFPCPWTSAWGEDRYGLWQMLKLGEVEQVFRWIEPGTFRMGSPGEELEREPWVDSSETQHPVILTGFWLADTTVTKAMWMAVMGGDNPSYFEDDLKHPVENVSWDDTQAFIDQLNQGLSGLRAQLPSEAQWEYACRAGTDTPFSFGVNITPDQVNYNGDFPYAGGEKGLYRGKTVAVKSLPANPWGLYEMHGNVWEWCQDVWQAELGTEAVVDPLMQSGKDAGGGRVLRGGSWNVSGCYVRSAVRDHLAPDYSSNRFGFRLALGHTEPRSSQAGGTE